jgi:hypothetical protein
MLHKTTAFIAVAILAVSVSLALASHKTDSVSGEWHITFKMGEHTGEGTMTLKLDGEKVTGTIETAHTGPGTLSNSTYKDGKLSFTADFAKHESINFTGEVKDGKIQGEFATEGMTGTWAATKS